MEGKRKWNLEFVDLANNKILTCVFLDNFILSQNAKDCDACGAPGVITPSHTD